MNFETTTLYDLKMNLKRFHFLLNYIRVTEHFVTSALNDLKATLYFLMKHSAHRG